MKKSIRKGVEVFKHQRKGGSSLGTSLRRAVSQKNPAKAVRLKNFTGIIRKLANGAVSVVGRAKKR